MAIGSDLNAIQVMGRQTQRTKLTYLDEGEARHRAAGVVAAFAEGVAHSTMSTFNIPRGMGHAPAPVIGYSALNDLYPAREQRQVFLTSLSATEPASRVPDGAPEGFTHSYDRLLLHFQSKYSG